MKIQMKLLLLFGLLMCMACSQASKSQERSKPKIAFSKQEADNKVDVLVNGELFTSYRWLDSLHKPILYPIITAEGTTITRGFPIDSRPGERHDHWHHVGNWFTYGDVNGYDFWGNIPKERKDEHGGEIKHHTIDKLVEGYGEGSMLTTANWKSLSGKQLLAEKTEFYFIAKDSIRIIDRIVTLTATAGDVLFKDTKEGSFGIRVARQLELPSKEEVSLTDSKGNPTTVKQMSNEGVTGDYRSSEGVTGDDVWSTRAKWMNLFGNIGNEEISLVICDHPKNLSYPTYWHARGYGLFAANPFGAKDFTKSAEELNYMIPDGKSITLRYRIVINSGSHLSDDQINMYADDFAKKY